MWSLPNIRSSQLLLFLFFRSFLLSLPFLFWIKIPGVSDSLSYKMRVALLRSFSALKKALWLELTLLSHYGQLQNIFQQKFSIKVKNSKNFCSNCPKTMITYSSLKCAMVCDFTDESNSLFIINKHK